jgi:ParB-like chromosome segregation protein Spo0J
VPDSATNPKTIVHVPLSDLQEAEVNPRIHAKRNLETIRSSLLTFGQVEPLVIRKANMEVIGGNGRLQVMRELGWIAADCVILDVDENTAKTLGLALNKTGDLAEYDFQVLGDVFRDLKEAGVDIETTGWADFEIESILQIEITPPEDQGKEYDEKCADDVQVVECPKCGEKIPV